MSSTGEVRGFGTPRVVDLRADGLLWLINRVVFHPRGFALGVREDAAGQVSGFVLYGDGTEAHAFAYEDEPELFAAVERTLAAARASDA